MSVFSGKRVQVLLPLPFNNTFTYAVPPSLEAPPGAIVHVPFGKRTVYGVVWTDPSPSDEVSYVLKEILQVVNLPALLPSFQKFVEWVASYYQEGRGEVLKMALCPAAFAPVRKASQNKARLTENSPEAFASLSPAQERAAAQISQCVSEEEFQVFLLQGVTGSGKTEVYFSGIRQALAQGKQSLILLPEIALGIQWLERFSQRFGFQPQVWNSHLTPAQRRETYKKIVTGEAKVVVAARSGLFLPFPRLGYMVLDEEHDPSYKQESGVWYYARDMAVVRASLEKIPCVLSSATPSLESLHNAREGKYLRLKLEDRHGGSLLPSVTLLDLRLRRKKEDKGYISRPLRNAVSEALIKGEQSLLFLNRRGYAPLMICPTCGYQAHCKNCDSSLVYHKHDNAFKCHLCGVHARSWEECPVCKAPLEAWGPGVEKIYEEAQEAFPKARLLLVTSDHLSTPQRAQACFSKISRREVDIIIGTQVMAKGHHFPHLTVIGIIDGDHNLRGEDFRGAERAMHSLHQVGGRAGRAELPGYVYIQTHMPEHPLMGALQRGDFEAFAAMEQESRQRHHFPPYGRLAAIIISGRQASAVEKGAKELARHIPASSDFQVWGPVPSYRPKVRGVYRWRFLVCAPRALSLQKYLSEWLGAYKKPSALHLQTDIDPQNFT